MPGFAHVAISLGLSLFVFKATRGKFTPKHAIIFTINSLVGPDLFGIIPYGDVYVFFHGYGWFVAAVPVALAWSLFTRCSLQWRPLKVTKRDPGREAIISIPEVFCLVAAGGIIHQLVDIIGHPPTINYEGTIVPWGAVWFGGDLWFSIQSVLGTGMFPCGNYFHFPEFYAYVTPVAAVAIALIMLVMPRGAKQFQIASAIIIAATFLPLAISYAVPDTSGFDVHGLGVNYFGSDAYIASTYRLSGGESDLGTMVLFGLFLFVPLILLWMGCDGIPFVKKQGMRAAIERIEKEERERIKLRIRELVASKVAVNPHPTTT